jgi:hypothetical protein
MRVLCYIAGKNLVIEWRFSEGSIFQSMHSPLRASLESEPRQPGKGVPVFAPSG